MAVKIRLKRLGKIRTPHYRIVVADAKTKRDGRVIEEIGRYIPTENPSFIEVNSERARYWLSVGAQPTEQVMVLLKLTGDYQASKGDKDAKNVVQVKAPKEPFVIDTKKKAVLLPKEEVVAKKAKAEPAEAPSETEAVAPEAEAVAAPAEAPAETPAETTEAVAEVVAEEVVVEAEAPVAEAAATEEAPVAEAAEAEKTTEA